MPTLEITTKIGCKNRCVYCPQNVLLKAYSGNEHMSLEQFKQILNNVPKGVRIDFSGFCEAFLNPEASFMMSEAIRNGYSTVLYTTLTDFNDGDLFMLKELKFTEVVFHEFEGKGFDKAEFDRKMNLFKESIKADVFRYVVLEPKWRWSRAGNVWARPVKQGKYHCLFAGKDFDHNVVLPNGDVYVCCQDYGLENKIGNLYTTHFNDLNRKYLTDASNEQFSDTICRKCELAQPE